MQELNYLLVFTFATLSLLVFLNTYNIFKLSRSHLKQPSIIDLQEFNDLHPMIKELYTQAVLKGFVPLQMKIINDIIYENNIDRWYDMNRTDLLDLLNTIKSISNDAYDKHKDETIPKLDPFTKKRLYKLDFKEFNKILKENNEKLIDLKFKEVSKENHLLNMYQLVMQSILNNLNHIIDLLGLHL